MPWCAREARASQRVAIVDVPPVSAPIEEPRHGATIFAGSGHHKRSDVLEGSLEAGGRSDALGTAGGENR